jgi:hypothetical protein
LRAASSFISHFTSFFFGTISFTPPGGASWWKPYAGGMLSFASSISTFAGATGSGLITKLPLYSDAAPFAASRW